MRAKGRSGKATQSDASEDRPQRRQNGNSRVFYTYVSKTPAPPKGLEVEMPPMSVDGGNEEEFQRYWRCNANPKRFEGGWIEYCSHPQVNAETYWYHEPTGEIAWEEPEGVAPLPAQSREGPDELTGEGAEWRLSPAELKQRLYAATDGGFGELRVEELARRAVAEYEQFVPRVLSWHDYQYNTFWFFGGMAAKKRGGRGRENFFDAQDTSYLFPPRPFFVAVAEVLSKRLQLMHPINLTYLIWTFTRAGVKLPALMRPLGDHLCDGLLPMMDRCSLGTMVWNYSKQGMRHDRLFERAAEELARPNRVRSLAPRNFQNSIIAYGKRKHWNECLVSQLLRGMPRLLDLHDCTGKLDRSLLFSYTCKDGSEVLADSFRISSLTVILRYLQNLAPEGENVRPCLDSFMDYVYRCVETSPRAMRTPGDACDFMAALIRFGQAVPSADVDELVLRADWPLLCRGAPARAKRQLEQALDEAGYPPQDISPRGGDREPAASWPSARGSDRRSGGRGW